SSGSRSNIGQSGAQGIAMAGAFGPGMAGGFAVPSKADDGGCTVAGGPGRAADGRAALLLACGLALVLRTRRRNHRR
ncbi:MAG TPA: hypothetical protein VJR89_11040, partial [Polyangiales bacterium]|nr:hypothetical protein [Polyangiales bacterium]